MKEFILSNPTDSKNLQIDYKKELNPEQFDVICQGNGPCLVLAGAGSGKTRTITYRVAYLIESGVRPDNILLVTFTNKAAREMLERVEMLLGSYSTHLRQGSGGQAGLWGGTFHSIANRILRIYSAQIGRTPNFTIIDTEDSKDLIKICVKELKIDTKARRFPSPNNLLSMISFSRNSAQSIKDVIEYKYGNFFDLIPTIERIAELYEEHKQQADAVDFDDLLLLLRNLLFNNPSIRERLASQFKYILVDEYQDTNVIQADIINQLASVHNNILVVGDDAQSIYSFRAADIQNILNFPKTYSQTKTFRLTTNYRSTPDILDLANSIIAYNSKQFKKDLESVCKNFEKPYLVPASTSPQEAQYICEQILTLRDEGVDLRNIAVLFRAAFHSQSLEFELMKRDIPYEYRGGMKFFERAHVKDIVAHLRLVANPKDEAAWMRVLGRQTGIGLITAGKIFEQARLFEKIDDVINIEIKVGSRAEIGWKQFQNTLKKMLVGNRQPADLIRAVVTSPYRDYLEAEYPDFIDRLEDIEQFAIFAEGYDNLTKFLEEVSLTDQYGAVREERRGDPMWSPGDNEQKIILSTIHQAKGLEWDAVFVMNLSDGKFPNQRALDEDGGLEEERRLFYVATTRARKYLYLTYPISSGYDTLMISPPSQFIQEIPEELIEQIRLKEQPQAYKKSSWDTDEVTIVLDDFGEVSDKTVPTSFLRNIEDL